MSDETAARPRPSPPRRSIFRTLYGRLAAILFGLFLLLGLLYTAWMVRTSQLYLQEVNQKLNVNLAKHLAAERILLNDGRINKAAAEETFRTLMAIAFLALRAGTRCAAAVRTGRSEQRS